MDLYNHKCSPLSCLCMCSNGFGSSVCIIHLFCLSIFRTQKLLKTQFFDKFCGWLSHIISDKGAKMLGWFLLLLGFGWRKSASVFRTWPWCQWYNRLPVLLGSNWGCDRASSKQVTGWMQGSQLCPISGAMTFELWAHSPNLSYFRFSLHGIITRYVLFDYLLKHTAGRNLKAGMNTSKMNASSCITM